MSLEEETDAEQRSLRSRVRTETRCERESATGGKACDMTERRCEGPGRVDRRRASRIPRLAQESTTTTTQIVQ